MRSPPSAVYHAPMRESRPLSDHPEPPPIDGGRGDVARLRSLTAKVLALAMAFTVFGVLVVFLSSIADFRLTWLKNRMSMAEVAILAVQAAPQRRLSDDLRHELLRSAGVRVVAFKRGGSRRLVLHDDMQMVATARYDLRRTGWAQAVRDALATLAAGGDRIITVIDKPPMIEGRFIELAMDERALYRDLRAHALAILKVSLALAISGAALLYLAIHWLLIRPISRLNANMRRFADDPENPAHVISPSARRDELGAAQRQLRRLQLETLGLLQQKERLASLGLAVSKVSHELRNMLTQAHLISDRLARLDDPTVRKFAPKLIASLDRAIDYCTGTLKYGRVQEPPPVRATVAVRPVVDEVFAALPREERAALVLVNEVPADLVADADPGYLQRIIANLVNNAAQALATRSDASTPGRIVVGAWREGALMRLRVADNGPGLPEQARRHLFEPFHGSTRRGGTGLGLAIAKQLAVAHGGDLKWIETHRPGAAFELIIPDRAVDLAAARARRDA